MNQDIIDKINAAGSDNHEFFGGTWTGGYHIQQDPNEFAELVELLQRFKFEDALSIGIAAGGNERFLCENVDIKRLTVIDDGNHPNFKTWEVNKDAINRKCKIGVGEYIGDSHSEAARESLEWYNHKFDLIGIDGDHSPQGVLQDWELVQSYLAPGAIIWFHDILIDIPGQHGARKLWQRLKTQYDVLLETQGFCGIGVIRVD